MKKTYKLLAFLLALVLTLPMLAPALTFDTSADNGWDGVSVATRFQKGSGTSSNPYRIATAEQLAYMAKVLNDPTTAASYYNKHFLLVADIDLGGKEWTPISNTTYTPAAGTKRFAGTFNGGGYTISNLYIGECKAGGSGLFGITQGATIKNLTLEGRVEAGAANVEGGNAAPGAAMLAPAMFSTTVQNVTIYTDMNIKKTDVPNMLYTGVFCGYTGLSTTPTTFENCHAYGSLTVSLSLSGNVTVGGLVSHSKAVTIKNCSSDVDIYLENVSNSGAFVGGILGDNYSDFNAHTSQVTTIEGCTYTGDIYAYSSGHLHIGGIIGMGGRGNSAAADSATYGGTLNIKSCAFDGNIYTNFSNSGRVAYTAAIVGFCRATITNIENCFTTSTDLPIYNKDPDWVEAGGYGTSLTLNDKGGHVTGIGIQTELGAAVRLTEGSSGLRFTSMIDRTLYDNLTKRSDLSIQLGTLIAPTTYVEGAGGFTFDKLTEYKELMGHSAAYLDVPFNLGEHSWLDSQYSNAESENLHYFSGAIANILDKNYNRSFSGVGYLSITTSDGYTLTFYGDYNDAARARTVSYVATRALNDLSDTQSSKYAFKTPEGKYSPYSATKRSKLNVFASKYDATTVVTDPIELVKNGKSEYSIVYPLGADAKDRDLAIYLQQTIRNLTGVSLPIYESSVQTDVYAKEIVVGCTDRAGAYSYNTASLDNGYRIFTDNERIIMLGDTPQALGTAVRVFVKNFFGVDITTQPTGVAYDTVTVPRAINLAKNGISTAPLNISFSSFKIAYSSNNEIEKRMAYSLRDSIALATGGTIEYTTITKNNKNYTDRTLVGGTQLSVSTLAFGTRIQLSTNDKLADGDFRISTSAVGNTVVIKIEASSYYGFEGAEDYLIAESLYGIAPLTTAGFTTAGNFEYWLTRLEESSKYAYNQAGDARVMFYNVLFGTSASSGTLTMEVPTAERNRLQAQMIAQYMPDVLGCQEFNLSKRGDAGSDNLVTLLEKLGYVEAIDPVVDNASNQEFWLGGAVKDENGKLLGYKPGNGKPVGYAVDANKYGFGYTYYNNTPLFYNAATTKLITAEYYWYENQWELGELVTDKYGTYYPSVHENSVSDCGSKAATWGLFEDLEYGNQYIVITTHMCTRNDNIRGLQAQEINALVAELTAKYNVPVFFGGDMNGTLASQNIQHFLYEAKFTDATFTGICEQFTSHVYSAHGYPDLETMASNVTMMQPSSTENTYFNDNFIDRIMMANHDSITPEVFGTISDECTRSASDHYPVFIDFSFNDRIKEPAAPAEEWSKRY